MSDKIMEAGNSADGNRCIIEKIITIPGLNLFITSERQHESYFALSILLSVADVAGFLDKKPGHDRVLVSSGFIVFLGIYHILLIIKFSLKLVNRR